MGKRIYQSGTNNRWAFWRWSDAQLPYLTRLFILKTPWLTISMHWIHQADIGLPHDHTSNFLSIILKGWYIEQRSLHGREKTVKRRWFNWVNGAEWDTHRIVEASEGGVATLCFLGRKKREWYYYSPVHGQIHWSQIEHYVGPNDSK